MKSIRQKIIIIGHGYTSRLSLIRSLAPANCEIVVIAMVFHDRIGRFLRFEGGRPIDCCSKYVNKVYYCEAKDEEQLVKLLLEKCADPGRQNIIIPDSDFSASVIDRHQDSLKDLFVFPHIHQTPGAVLHWMNKDRQKALARELGLNVAEGRIVTITGGTYEIPEEISFPCFTKPLKTVGGGKQFLRRCDDLSALRKVLDEIRKKGDMDVLVEDFKRIDKEFAVVGLSNGKDVCIPGIIQFSANSRSHFGIAREGRVFPTDGFEEILARFREYLRRVGFYGLFDIDFYESDGRMYFGELNLRFGGSGYALTKMGVNLPLLFVRSLQGGETAGYDALRIQGEATFVNERMCVDDWSFYYITKEEMTRMIEAADIHFIYDKTDTGPQVKLERYIRLQQVKRWLRKMLSVLHV